MVLETARQSWFGPGHRLAVVMLNVGALGAFPKLKNISSAKIDLAESQHNGNEKTNTLIVWRGKPRHCFRRLRKHEVTVTVSTRGCNASGHRFTVRVSLVGSNHSAPQENQLLQTETLPIRQTSAALIWADRIVQTSAELQVVGNYRDFSNERASVPA